jgi:uncharacterized protein (TIGR01777 family)
MTVFLHSSRMPAPVEDLAAWHFRDGALDRLLPPWQKVRVVGTFGGVAEGSIAELELSIGGIPIRWRAVHEDVDPERGFRDRQVQGPFASWVHDHRFMPEPEGHSLLEDRIEYAIRFGPVGRLLAGAKVRADLDRTFAFRHDRLRHDLRRHVEDRTLAGPDAAPLQIALTGSSGMVGRPLRAFLATGGHHVRRVVRGRPDRAAGDVSWDPVRGEIDGRGLEAMDAVVHLAGENIAAGRWTPARMASIRSSRVEGTRLLCEALAKLERPPRVLVSASAVGVYGDRPDLDAEGDPATALDESGPQGAGFLAETAAAWEAATRPAEEVGIRVVHLRIGVVVSATGGIVAKLRPPFSLGLGGPVGHGRQAMPWIALDDLIAAILWSIRREDLSGPINAVAPQPRSNRTFGRDLARAMRRPFLAPLPAFIVKAAFGRMGRELLLGGAPVAPRRLSESGFRFDFPTLDRALAFEFGRPHPESPTDPDA